MDLHEEELRVQALCRKLGTLWSNKSIIPVDHLISAQKKFQGACTLIGSLFLNPKVNVQAFKATMKKVWKQDNVEIELLAPGIFEFQFASQQESCRILSSGPWSFANHLLLLQAWRPNTPPARYRFDQCAFWVHIHGLPSEWISEEMVRGVAEDIGTVTEVKIDTKGYLPYKIGKARVMLNTKQPLQIGSMFSGEGRRVWLDYKYARLPYFCYSCGRMGHYARHCPKVEFADDLFNKKKDMSFGPWLKTEHDDYSPFWDLFYGASMEEILADEEVPETPRESRELVVYEEPMHVEEDNLRNRERRMGKRINTEGLGGTQQVTESGTEDNRVVQPNFLIPCPQLRQAVGEKSCKKSQKLSVSKKAKRFDPYAKPGTSTQMLDESTLLDTPVQILEEEVEWAWVAGPKQPPNYK